MESKQKGLSRKNNAPERRIDRKRENFSRFWLGATSSASHTLSFWRLKRSITLEYNSQLLPFPDTSLDVIVGHISSFPHFYSDEFMSFTFPWSFLSRHQSQALLASRARL